MRFAILLPDFTGHRLFGRLVIISPAGGAMVSNRLLISKLWQYRAKACEIDLSRDDCNIRRGPLFQDDS